MKVLEEYSALSSKCPDMFNKKDKGFSMDHLTDLNANQEIEK